MRYVKRAVVAAAIGASVATLIGQNMKLDFEGDEVGKSPKGFSFGVTGQGKAGVLLEPGRGQQPPDALL